jgi:hypothetical protein
VIREARPGVIPKMNIFYLDRDIGRAVRYHCDRHVVKMPLETAQILCTALRRHGIDAPYRPTHPKHPSVLWAGDSLAHWRWLRRFGKALCREYSHRYGRRHASEDVIDGLPEAPPIPDRGWRDPPQAMPEACKRADAVAGYRAFYRAEKAAFAKWSNRRGPPFMRPAPALSAEQTADTA